MSLSANGGKTVKPPTTARLFWSVAVVVAVLLAANLALAINPNPKIFPPHAKPYGMTYGAWEGVWWQWALKATVDANPILDTTGEYAVINQSGQVFFLAGTFGGGAVERTFTVPAGKALLIPIVNWILTYPEDTPAGLSPEEAETWMRQTLNDTFNPMVAADLLCTVDGVAVLNPLMYRAQSEAFDLYLPADCASVTDWLSYQGVPYQEGWHYPNVSDGFWVMLAPLPSGSHVIRLKYPATGAEPWLDVTFRLTVAAQ
jgi:hypothetical protein